MSGGIATPATDRSLTVLAVLVDVASRAQLELVARELGDRLLLAGSVDEALAIATREPLDLALVDVALDDGAALALVHHIPALRPGARLVAVVHRDEVARGADALTLGADALHILPLAGDTVASTLGAARARVQEAHARTALTEELARAREHLALHDQLVHLARAPLTGDPEEAWTARLEQLGARASTLGLDLEPLTAPLQRARIPAEAGSGLLSHDETRLFSKGYLANIGAREVDRARRHGRRLAALMLRSPGARGHARAVLARVRSSDILAQLSSEELVLLLPETSAFGAHSCRARLSAELESETPLGVGVATFPHDGDTLSALLHAARLRSRADLSSVAIQRRLGPMALGELVDALVHQPLLGQARVPVTAPLDLPVSALGTIVEHVCADARRAGLATYLGSDHPGKGLAWLARALLGPGALPAPPPSRGDARPERRARELPRSSVELRDVRHLPGCSDVLAIVVRAEPGVWIACGRLVRERFVGVHTRDPRVADLVSGLLEQGLRRSAEESSP